MSDLIDQKEALKGHVEELITTLPKNDAEIILLNAKLAQVISEGPSSADIFKLKEENEKQAQEIKSLTQQLLQVHQDHNARLTMLIQSFAYKSSIS